MRPFILAVVMLLVLAAAAHAQYVVVPGYTYRPLYGVAKGPISLGMPMYSFNPYGNLARMRQPFPIYGPPRFVPPVVVPVDPWVYRRW